MNEAKGNRAAKAFQSRSLGIQCMVDVVCTSNRCMYTVSIWQSIFPIATMEVVVNEQMAGPGLDRLHSAPLRLQKQNRCWKGVSSSRVKLMRCGGPTHQPTCHSWPGQEKIETIFSDHAMSNHPANGLVRQAVTISFCFNGRHLRSLLNRPSGMASHKYTYIHREYRSR